VKQYVPSRLTPLAKNLRKQSTDTEQRLWRHLKTKYIGGLKFRRQQPIGPHIVDFVCFEKKIIIELDGGQHGLPTEMHYDTKRDQWFEAQGYKVLRLPLNVISGESRNPEVLDITELPLCGSDELIIIRGSLFWNNEVLTNIQSLRKYRRNV
jgi:very-short-patch-repair endonuclease